jgi:hypothetical protein
MDILLIPCIYLTNVVRGALGSLFLMYKYSATWRSMPIELTFQHEINA